MITGSVIAWNCFVQDFPLKACLDSLFTVCDRVMVDTLPSHDGTAEFLRGYPGIEVHEREAPPPGTLGQDFLRQWRQEAVNRVTEGSVLLLDGDEVIHEDDAERWKAAAASGGRIAPRYIHVLAPDAWGTNPEVLNAADPVRLAPAGTEVIADAGTFTYEGRVETPTLRIFHYGFARHLDALLVKCRQHHRFVTGHESGCTGSKEELQRDWLATRPRHPLVGTHPVFIHHWLNHHAYE